MANVFWYVFDIPTLTQLLIMPMTGLGYVFVNQYSPYSSLLNCLFFGSIDGVLHVQYLDKTYCISEALHELLSQVDSLSG